ncbi:MAG: MFS transporter, partial [Alphaproteobacteria bacterium]|nr:MFS transporter [Alphaproteobacteria bacterium]
MESRGRESNYAWLRAVTALALITISAVGMYGVVVALKPVGMEFGASRAVASVPYAATMLGFGFGGLLMGRWADRKGVFPPSILGVVALPLGFLAASQAQAIWQFAAAQGLLIGLLGASAFFAPLIADTTHWFDRRRGRAVALVISGTYLAGAVWPPIVQHFIDAVGWRQTYLGLGLFCFA